MHAHTTSVRATRERERYAGDHHLHVCLLVSSPIYLDMKYVNQLDTCQMLSIHMAIWMWLGQYVCTEKSSFYCLNNVFVQ